MKNLHYKQELKYLNKVAEMLTEQGYEVDDLTILLDGLKPLKKKRK